MPLSEFRRIRSSHDSSSIKNNIGGTEDKVLQEILVDSDSGMVDLNLFSDLVDLYVYMPSKDRDLKNQQSSPNIHYILSSNMKSKATA